MRTTLNRITALIATSFFCCVANAVAQVAETTPPAVINVTDAKGVVALSESNGWQDIPAFLKGASVHNRPGKPTIPARDIEFGVETAGVVVVLASWAYDGNSSGGWHETRSTHKRLEREGWVHLGTMTLKRRKKTEPYSIFRRVFKGGEKVRFHTRKYNPALALSFDKKLASLVMAQKAVVKLSNNIAALKVPAGPPQGLANDALDVVMLNTHGPDKTKRGLNEGMLLRELVRQAFLVAARDELGKFTRDRSLREEFPNDPQPLNVPFDIIVSLRVPDYFSITVFRRSGSKYQVLWDDAFELPKTALIRELTAKAEAFSRNEFRGVLTRAGFDGKAKPFRPTAPVPEEVDEQLQQWNFIAQYTALRQLHAHVRANGESPELLAALARGYANLGSLTAFHWSPAHKAFMARALLYAERLVSNTKSSPWSMWHRAYVRTLVGLYQLALDDIQAAKTIGVGTGILHREPEWGRLLEAFCLFEPEKIAAAEKGPHQSLARYLSLLAVEGSSSQSSLLQAAANVMEVSPDCFRAVDMTCSVRSLGTKSAGSYQGMRFFAATLYNRLSAIADLPKPLQKLVDDQLQGNSDFSDEVELRAKVIKSLQESETNREESSEPSLSVLGQLVRETSYVHLWRVLELKRRWQSINADADLEQMRPLVAGHPYESYLDSFAWDETETRPALQKLAKSVDLAELGVSAFPMVSDIYRTFGLEEYNRLAGPMFAHKDEVYRDLLDILSRDVSTRERKKLLLQLSAVAPHMPMTIAWTISLDWKAQKSHATDWEDKYANYPVVLGALASQFVANRQTVDAVRVLSRQIEIAPEKGSYTTLANLYKGQGQLDKWQETLDQYLQTPSLGLEHAQVRVTLARHFMEKKEWDKASPYATAAASSGAAWAMLCAADCYEGLKDWKTAEQYVRSTSRRYRDSKLNWFYWCHRTGQGDSQAAQEFALKYLETLKPPLPRFQLDQIGVYYILIGEPEKAFQVFQAAYQKFQHPYDAVHAALLADELGDADARDELFKSIADVASKSKSADAATTTIVRLSAQFQTYLANGNGGTLDTEALAKLLKTAPRGEPTNVYYFVGRFEELRAKKETAVKYLRLSASSPETIKYNCVLANARLRKHGVEAGEKRDVE